MADFFQEMIGSIDSLSEEQLQELLSILNAKQSTKKLKAVSNNDYQGTITLVAVPLINCQYFLSLPGRNQPF